jgi:hypothetical protein
LRTGSHCKVELPFVRLPHKDSSTGEGIELVSNRASQGFESCAAYVAGENSHEKGNRHQQGRNETEESEIVVDQQQPPGQDSALK